MANKACEAMGREDGKVAALPGISKSGDEVANGRQLVSPVEWRTERMRCQSKNGTGTNPFPCPHNTHRCAPSENAGKGKRPSITHSEVKNETHRKDRIAFE